MDLVFSRIRKVSNKSFGRECSLCSSRHGVPIECSARGCKVAYHTTCAIRGKLKMQAIFGRTFKGGIKLRSYCKEHSPSINLETNSNSPIDKIDCNGLKEIDMTNLADDDQESNEELDFFWKYVDINEVYRKISEQHTKTDEIIRDIARDHDSTARKNLSVDKRGPSPKRNKKPLDFEAGPSTARLKSMHQCDPLTLDLIYRYWILLRTSNNGQSLIKFSPSALKERENEQRKSILRLRIELERVRNLSYMIGKREKMKACWLKTHQNIIKRTFSIINNLNPVSDAQPTADGIISPETPPSNRVSHHNLNSQLQNSAIMTNGKRSLLQTQIMQPSNGIFDESDQLINDLISCDQIYELPRSSNTNYNHSNLSYQDRSTLERRRTLSLVRRINRQLKSVSIEP